MRFDELEARLNATGIPFTHNHWEKPPKPTYGVYLPTGTNNFGADNISYAVIEKAAIELYSVGLDQKSMDKIEQMLDNAEIYWERDPVVYIEELRLYQTRYEIEV